LNEAGKLVYLASPYTHLNHAVREARFVEACFFNGWVMNHQPGIFFYSPIVHCHPISMRCELPGEWEFWASFDECLISRCQELWILCIPGWTKSTGVKAERKIAEKFGIPIRFVVLHPEFPIDDKYRYEMTNTEPEDTYVAQHFS